MVEHMVRNDGVKAFVFKRDRLSVNHLKFKVSLAAAQVSLGLL